MDNNPITDIQYLVNTLLGEINSLKKEVAFLRKENAELRDKLSHYEHPKSSSNSNLPPSKDSIGKPKNLREPSSRPSGGQKGHQGTTLTFQTPDKIELLFPHYCQHCGKTLSEVEGQIAESRQQIDLPLVQPIVTEYRTVNKICTCGHVCHGSFPKEVSSSIGYGPNIHALVGYLSVCQHIPFKRLTVLLKDFCHLPISQGTVQNILCRLEKRTYPAYQAIRQLLSIAPVVGVDETSTNINGKNRWSWVFQNNKATYITSARSRKKEVFTDVMPNGMPFSTLVADCYAAYFSQNIKTLQTCIAHLLREIKYLAEIYPDDIWHKQLFTLLLQALQARKNSSRIIDATSFIDELDKLINQSIDGNYPKCKTLQKRLKKYKNHIFVFLQDPRVPPDNNASERAFRVFKIKQKVSGFFKSDNGAQRFAQIHSIADTARKNSQSPLLALHVAAINF